MLPPAANAAASWCATAPATSASTAAPPAGAAERRDTAFAPPLSPRGKTAPFSHVEAAHRLGHTGGLALTLDTDGGAAVHLHGVAHPFNREQGHRCLHA